MTLKILQLVSLISCGMIIEVNVFQESLAAITTTVPHSKQFEILAGV